MEPTTADAILVFGKNLATRPAVIDGLLRLSKTFGASLADVHSVWLGDDAVTENQENVSLLNAVQQPVKGLAKDLPSLDDVLALEKHFARCVHWLDGTRFAPILHSLHDIV